MIISTILFNDEYDMLEIYLEITSQYCDRWIIAEADKTFSGMAKPFNLANNRERFAKWWDRIDLMKLSVPEGYKDWQVDNWSRVSIQEQINKYPDDTIFLHGDVDEVTDPRVVPKIIEAMNQHNKPVALSMWMFIYKFDQRAARGWKGTVWARKHMFENPQQLIKGGMGKRKNRSHCVSLHEAGWHWTWMGDDERIRSKIRSCIESQNRDVEATLEAFKRQDIGVAINLKCVTEYCADPGYPTEVMQVIARYPFWTNQPGNFVK